MQSGAGLLYSENVARAASHLVTHEAGRLVRSLHCWCREMEAPGSCTDKLEIKLRNQIAREVLHYNQDRC